MATKKELEAENARLKRELGSSVDTGAAQAAKAQAAMNASNEMGRETSLESRSVSQERRMKHQAAVRGEVEEAVVVEPEVEEPEVEEPEVEEAEEVEVEETDQEDQEDA